MGQRMKTSTSSAESTASSTADLPDRISVENWLIEYACEEVKEMCLSVDDIVKTKEKWPKGYGLECDDELTYFFVRSLTKRPNAQGRKAGAARDSIAELVAMRKQDKEGDKKERAAELQAAADREERAAARDEQRLQLMRQEMAHRVEMDAAKLKAQEVERMRAARREESREEREERREERQAEMHKNLMQMMAQFAQAQKAMVEGIASARGGA